MNLRVQKRLASQILKCSPDRVIFDENNLDEIKEAITKRDIKSLIADKLIQKKPVKGISKVRTRKIQQQKRKGLRKGAGSRKGRRSARAPSKRIWINKIRVQREFLKILKTKELLLHETYKNLMAKAKGGFFRSRKHLKVFIEENKLFKKTEIAHQKSQINKKINNNKNQ